MAVEFEVSDTINAPREQVFAYFLNVRNIPKYHPKMARNVEVLEENDEAIKYRLEAKVLMKKIESMNTMSIDREKGQLITDTTEGDGKGSKITMDFTEVSGKTELTLKATMELGTLGSLGKGRVASMWKDVVEQAKKILETGPETS